MLLRLVVNSQAQEIPVSTSQSAAIAGRTHYAWLDSHLMIPVSQAFKIKHLIISTCETENPKTYVTKKKKKHEKGKLNLGKWGKMR